MALTFNQGDLKKLYTPPSHSSGEDNGQVTIIAGSELFHGAPMLATTVASRIVDMVFFSSPYSPLQTVADKIKSELFSFIWVPFNEVEEYIEKSDAVLIGPGFMRYRTEDIEQSTEKARKKMHFFQSHEDRVGQRTRKLTRHLLENFPNKKWVIDGGSLQVMEPEWIPEGAIITPNKKEFQTLFDTENVIPDLIRNLPQETRIQILKQVQDDDYSYIIEIFAKKYKCIIVLKGPTTIVSDGNETILVEGGNAGLTKGGTGDTLAGLTVALLAKNDPMLAACAASYIIKKAADELFKEVGTNYNADDVAHLIPRTISMLA